MGTSRRSRRYLSQRKVGAIMENIINHIITLDNEEKYMIVNQAIYQKRNYFLAVKVTEDEEDVLNEIKLLEETDIDGEKAVVIVQDEKIIELLTKYFTPKEEQ